MIVGGGSGNFKQPETGLVRAVLTRIIDLGTQEVTYKGETKKSHKLMLAWEIDQLMDDKRPYLVTQQYTASLHEKAVLRKHLESWRGRAFTEEEAKSFDLKKLLSVPCMLNLIKNGEYTNISAISPMMKGMEAIKPAAELIHFDLGYFNQQTFARFSEKLREKIAKSPEYSKAIGADSNEAPFIPNADDAPAADDNDIPF